MTRNNLRQRPLSPSIGSRPPPQVMPTYDYQCDACGFETEIFQRITELPVERCPQCKKKKFRRLFGTGAAVMFKGSGFYQTDYRSESYRKAAEKDSAKGTSDKKPDKPDQTKKADKADQTKKAPKPAQED